MSVYERYQIMNTAEQRLFDPAAPVYVYRTQLSRDLREGGVLLQARMVNMGGRTLGGIYLRVECLDAGGQLLSTLHYVPVTELNVPAGGVFGDDRILPLQERRTAGVRVFVQRAVFEGGAVWNEAEAPDYTLLPAPAAVLPTDPDYGELARISRSGGVKNDVRYQTLSCGWYCTCGLPNGNLRQCCGYCGADREWLYAHMRRPETAAPAPAAEEAAPLAEEEPAPVFFAPVLPEREVTEAPAYGREEEFPVIAPTPEPVKRKGRAGRIIAVLLLVLGTLALLGYGAWRYGLPALRYTQAARLEAQGDYAQAREAFAALGDYRDAEERIRGTWYLQARQLMQQGGYQEAYSILTTISGYEDADKLAADCLCSLGILAFNKEDYDGAWDYAERIREKYPAYTGAEDLRHQTAYQLGLQAMAGQDYETAKGWFALADGFSDSDVRSISCDYWMARQLLEDGDYEAAVEACQALGSYADAEALALDAMYGYLTNTELRDPELETEYMERLLLAQYPGAGELHDWSVTIWVNESDAAGTTVTAVKDLTKLRIHYRLEGGMGQTPLQVVLIYTLPNKQSGSVQILSDGTPGDAGSRRWTDLNIPACEEGGAVTLKFCDGANGDTLYTCTLTLQAEEKTEDKTENKN